MLTPGRVGKLATSAVRLGGFSIMDTTWQAGDRVLAWWPTDGTFWYPATVLSVEPNHIRIKFDDGDSRSALPNELMPFDVGPGSHVQCRWKGGRVYYPGIIDDRAGEGVHIKYDDGDEEWAQLDKIRVERGVPPSPAANPPAQVEAHRHRREASGGTQQTQGTRSKSTSSGSVAAKVQSHCLLLFLAATGGGLVYLYTLSFGTWPLFALLWIAGGIFCLFALWSIVAVIAGRPGAPLSALADARPGDVAAADRSPAEGQIGRETQVPPTVGTEYYFRTYTHHIYGRLTDPTADEFCPVCGSSEFRPKGLLTWIRPPVRLEIRCNQCGNRIRHSIWSYALDWARTWSVLGVVPCWVVATIMFSSLEPERAMADRLLVFGFCALLGMLPLVIVLGTVGWMIGLMVALGLGRRSTKA
jgi:hypothetical protein